VSHARAVGIANDNNVINNISGTNIFGIRAFYPDLGYIPFVELHKISGTVVNDDFFNSSFPSGAYFQIERTQATGGTSNPGSPLGLSALFAVYQIPVPSQ